MCNGRLLEYWVSGSVTLLEVLDAGWSFGMECCVTVDLRFTEPTFLRYELECDGSQHTHAGTRTLKMQVQPSRRERTHSKHGPESRQGGSAEACLLAACRVQPCKSTRESDTH